MAEYVYIVNNQMFKLLRVSEGETVFENTLLKYWPTNTRLHKWWIEHMKKINEVCEKLNLMSIGYSNLAKVLLEWAWRETAM